MSCTQFYTVISRPRSGRLTLSVGCVDPNDILEFTLAASELAIGVGCRHVVITSQKIIAAIDIIQSTNVDQRK